jgi:hypothetical protein
MKAASKRKVSAKLARRTRHIAPQRQQAIVKAVPTVAEAIEKVLLGGDLSSLSVDQRLEYYNAVCKSLGLNPLTRPFAYIAFDGKLMLYARKDCTEQLRKIHGIAIVESNGSMEDGFYTVFVKAQDKHGRTDTGTGVVEIGNLKGKDRANAIMKCETKAKRRATLSMAGLGFLDESELDTVPEYGAVSPAGRIVTISPKQTEAESNWEKREAEGIQKLNPEQRAIVEQRLSEAKAKEEAGLWYKFHTESGMYEVDGLHSLKAANKDILGPLYNKAARCILLIPEQLGELISQLEYRKVPFKEIANG